MATDAAIDQVRRELDRAFDRTRVDLDRIEILAAGLAAFSAPIPAYEPKFQHLRRVTVKAQELTSDGSAQASIPRP